MVSLSSEFCNSELKAIQPKFRTKNILMSAFKLGIKGMVNKTDLILLVVLAKLEYEILDEMTKNPKLSDNEIENLLPLVKSLSDEINSRISAIINKK